jgi:hypothetical protein
MLPKLTQQPDYEAEFAFVIDKGGKNIPAVAKLACVLSTQFVEVPREPLMFLRSTNRNM